MSATTGCARQGRMSRVSQNRYLIGSYRRANDCVLAHRAVVVGLVEHGRVQVFTLRLAAVLAVDSFVAIAAVTDEHHVMH